MFSRFASLLPLAALAAVASASSQCNTGPNYCCNSSQYFTGGQVTFNNGVLGDTLIGVGVNAGLTCSPITVGGVGAGSSCTQQPVCCTNNNFNGVVNVGCVAINA